MMIEERVCDAGCHDLRFLFFNSTPKKKLETMSFLKIFDALPLAKRNPNNDAHRSS